MPQLARRAQKTHADARPHERLSAMINQGRSFSGNERNCCFLNLGTPNEATHRFANISAGSGLDFPDDGRAVAVVDWDADGDLDLWISNRNAPRLRLMRNDTPAENRFLALRLQDDGQGTNRDAVGARVEVILTRDADRSDEDVPRRLVTSLRAGEGFLAQSSKWLHFGLGSAENIEKVLVRWPSHGGADGRFEVFVGLQVDRRYRLVQGSGKPQAIPPQRPTVELIAAAPNIPPTSRTARVPVVTLLQGPTMNIQAPGGTSSVTGTGKPVLINLFASWCPACLVELKAFADREADIRAAGIDIVALSLDALDDERSGRATSEATLERLGFPFASAMANRALIAHLQELHDALVALHRPLPLPSSFLLDEQGRVSVIYKGPVSVDQLLGDFGHSKGTRAERWKRSAPLPGTTIRHPRVTLVADRAEASAHFRFAVQQETQNNLDDALYHFREALRVKPDFAVVQRRLGRLYFRMKKSPEAETHLLRAAGAKGDDFEAHYLLAKLYLQQRKLPQAQAHYERAVRLKPDYAAALYDLGVMLHTLKGKAAEAMGYYRRVLDVNAEHVAAQNNLAWLLATHPDEALRDGPEALRIARRVVAQSGGNKAFCLDLLAAAQAESGRFDEAILTAEKAAAVARAAGDVELAKEIEARLVGYRRQQPFRETPASKG